MALKEDLAADVDGILSAAWDLRDGNVVPETSAVALSGGGVKLDATMLYADLADSTELATNFDRRIAAKVIKSFLAGASRLIRAEGGYIRSFDGDRVMGVFLGDYKSTTATKVGLQINWFVREVLKPKIETKYPALAAGGYTLAHGVGIDTSEVLVVRGGLRNDNDLIWVGRCANVAAKLANLREAPYYTFITKDVFGVLNEEATHGGTEKKLMWEERSYKPGPGVTTVHRSSWWWTPS